MAPFGFSHSDVRAWVQQVELRHLPASASAAEHRQFRHRLHVADLVLARACAQGHAAAWEEFWRRYQPRLRAAARALTRDAGRAEELADGLLASLYEPQGGTAAPKLLAYGGLGSLEAWLCTLLAQAHVNLWRRERRQISLEECGTLKIELVRSHAEVPGASGTERALLDVALGRVLAAANPPARLLLSWYYLDGRTLAEIGLILRVHESTVSRRLERLLRQLRRQTRQQLRALGLRPAATEAALHTDPRWLRVDVRQSLHAQPQEGPRGI